MTHGRARSKSLPPGYAVGLVQPEGLQLYLADWERQPRSHTTPYPVSARYFATLSEACYVARLLDCVTGQKWTARTIRATIEPDPAGTVDLTRGWGEHACPDCRSRETTEVGGCLRCFACGNAWTPITLTPEQERQITFQQACRDFLLEDGSPEALLSVGLALEQFDDDDAEIVAASHARPGARPRVAPRVP